MTNRIIFVINPGSTSTKLAIFDGETERVYVSASHDASALKRYSAIVEQLPFRLQSARDFLKAYSVGSLDAIAARGGLLRPVQGGAYVVNQTMLGDLASARYGEHASNLGALIAAEISAEYGCKAFVVDPVVVDELEPVARISGLPALERKSIFHALNQKSAARHIARQLGKPYEQCNFIVAHLGGGISVGAHREGKVIDVNNALGGEGPLSPERSGGLPSLQLVELVEQTQDLQALKKAIVGQGGVCAYCGTNDVRKLRQQIGSGDATAKLVFEAMAYQVSKEIAQHGATLKGAVDRIILTGGLAHDPDLVDLITERVAYLAPVVIVPGEQEMVSLAESVLAVLDGRQEALIY